MTGVYLAQAIDQSNGVGKDTVDRVASWLKQHPGVSWLYDPSAAFSVGPAPAVRTPDIRSINLTALHRSGLLVAVLPAGTVSIGVPMEIESAASNGAQVVVISDAPSWSLEFEEDNVHLFSEWGPQAEGRISSILQPLPVQDALFEYPPAPTESTGGSGRALMPTLISEGAQEPFRGYEDDAGLDLVVSETVAVLPGSFVDIPCGVSVELPEWSFGLITGRSSTLRKRGLMVNQGVIDAGYRGPLFAGVWNLTDQIAVVERGQRVAQLLILHNGTRQVQVSRVESLSPGSRGDRGFGSSGV